MKAKHLPNGNRIVFNALNELMNGRQDNDSVLEYMGRLSQLIDETGPLQEVARIYFENGLNENIREHLC